MKDLPGPVREDKAGEHKENADRSGPGVDEANKRELMEALIVGELFIVVCSVGFPTTVPGGQNIAIIYKGFKCGQDVIIHYTPCTQAPDVLCDGGAFTPGAAVVLQKGWK
jgi:hypothetical protein